MITGEQIRAGRALARMEQSQLASASGLSLETIKRLERLRGPINANLRTFNALVSAFANIGVSFKTDNHGRQCVCLDAPGRKRLEKPLEASPAEPAKLHRLVYQSSATPETMANPVLALDDILRVAALKNEARGVGGALVLAGDRFIQALEGEATAVLGLFSAIRKDPRHTDIQVLESLSVDRRLFPNWHMCGSGEPMDLNALDLPAPLSLNDLGSRKALSLLQAVQERERRALGGGSN